MVFGSIDSIFMGVGLLAIIAGIYALLAWRGLDLHADNATFANSDRM
jgi:hypothetical protein